MTRAQKRRERYIAAGQPIVDHRGRVQSPADAAIAARRARIARALRDKVTDHTGVGFR